MSDRYIITPQTDTGQEENAEVRAVMEAVRNILATPKGTVPMRRDFGISMDLLSLPVAAAQQRLRMQITEAVEKWEPRAQVVRVSFAADNAAEGGLIPTVEVRILAGQ